MAVRGPLYFHCCSAIDPLWDLEKVTLALSALAFLSPFAPSSTAWWWESFVEPFICSLLPLLISCLHCSQPPVIVNLALKGKLLFSQRAPSELPCASRSLQVPPPALCPGCSTEGRLPNVAFRNFASFRKVTSKRPKIPAGSRQPSLMTHQREY